MTTLSKPLLYNGYEVTEGVSVENRVEKVFFTEIYLLSNKKYLYLFLNLSPIDIVDRGNKHKLLSINVGGQKKLGVIAEDSSHENINTIVDDLTMLHGFDCVAGMNELKALLLKDVIGPLQNPEKYKKFKLSIPKGILLFGPPGCGKTFIVKKLAEELGYNYVELNPSSVATSYVHGSVGNIGKVFEMAKLKAPSIVFIDEIEGLVPKREELTASADIKKEEVNEFLLQLNNAGANKILVVGATNRPNMIDTAILRSGRMDKRIYVPPPDFEARKDLFKIYLSGRPFDNKIDFEGLATLTEHYVSSDIELIVTEAARTAVEKNSKQIDEKMLREVVKKITPSITPGEIESYEEFRVLERS